MKKDNYWHHGMKAHAGGDAGSSYDHTITGMLANIHDIAEASKLVKEDDEVVCILRRLTFGYAFYQRPSRGISTAVFIVYC